MSRCPFKSVVTVSSGTMVCLVLVLLLELLPTQAATEEAYVTMARCRIRCLKEFLAESKQADDNFCRNTNTYKTGWNKHCNSCWNSCEKFISNSVYLEQGCTDGRKDCDTGCRTACAFAKYRPKAHGSQGIWRFPKEIITEPKEPHEVYIEWKRPYLLPGSTNVTSQSNGPMVFVLAARNRNSANDGWAVMTQLLVNFIRISTAALPYSPEFLLFAVTESGLICQIQFETKSMVAAVFTPPSGPELTQLHVSEKADWYIRMKDGINATLTLATKLNEKGTYETQEAELKFRGPEWQSQDKTLFFNMVWYLMDCRDAYEDVPECTLAENHAAMQYVTANEESAYTIRELKFNSIYGLVIYLSEDNRIRTEIVFKTEPCMQPDVIQLTQCLDDIEEDKLSKIPVVVLERVSEPEILKLSVNVTSMTLQPNTDRVLVNVTWSPVLNQSVMTYNVTTYTDSANMALARHATAHPYIVLTLEQDTQYYVMVEAIPKPSVGGEAVDSLRLTETLQINTSDVNLAIYQGPQAFSLNNQGEMDQVNGIIIGVTCFLILILMVLAAILYKKRKSFKDIIVTKATVAKSNSYKSNVGGKSDYSNQLIVFTDEWELDPSRLKFSTLLGQGAFGKVVTGYYDDQKVAIKLVREGAPISYKEDLVAEINLMKRIGSHPNIVCLIGACSLSEPIALVMEYVPYGNLQNFLKKCRLEGDLRKRSDGPMEITYTVIQESGSMESGVVTPADMLSFARQVSMAMEYLTEKKYVHRDLAARNVLIDYNKVVKVCDFGLSRDIFNDNHYKKLTNGKLPLKWMAIESLRDRIFTTQSDVWSFGILLWEIVTMGASPYPNVALADLYYVLSNGYRMDRPSNCSEELYNIMRSCWEDEPTERPNFTQLRIMLEDLLTEDRDYLVLEDIDVPISNSDSSSSPSPPPNSDNAPSSTGSVGATAGLRSYPNLSANTSSIPSHPAKAPKKVSPRRDSMRINVCIHQKSTDRLIRPSESDSSPSSC